MNREHAIEVATDTLMKRYKGIRKVLLRADAKAVVNRLTYLEDARIAELTTEVADLNSKLAFANAMNADQDKAVAGLTAEVARYREALQSIVDKCSDGNECDAEKVNQDCRRIARNALKEGV